MSINKYRQVANLIPEAEGIVKKANLEQEFSTSSKDASLASYLKAEYMMKVAHEPVPPTDFQRVKKAIQLYDLEEEAERLVNKMIGAHHEKVANDVDQEGRIKAAQSYFESQLSGAMDIEKMASYAEQLLDQYGDAITSDEVRRYAGAGVLNKEASIAGLVSRAKLTKDPEFAKVAKVIEASKDGSLDQDDIRLICHAVTQMDKQANLGFKGYNFYKEAVMTKRAELASSLTIKLGGKSTPVESIYNVGRTRVAHALGDDVAQEMFDSDPQGLKAVVESLPMDMQTVLGRMING